MQYLEIIFFTLAIIALLAGLGVAALKFLERRPSSVTLPSTRSPNDDALQATLKNLNAQLASLHEKNSITENQLANLQKKSPEKSNVVLHTTTLHTAEFIPYQYALQLLQEGADINTLRKQFNLSRGELDVLQALHIKDTHLRHLDSQVL